MRRLLLFALTLPFAASAAPDCVWVYPENPYAGPAACLESAFPPRTADQPFRLVEEVFGLTFEDAAAQSHALWDEAPAAPWATAPAGLQPSREFQSWAVRMVAHHLGRMHEFLRDGARREFVSRPLKVRVSGRETAMGVIGSGEIEIGGRYALTSEAVYHEYGHHVLEWERPGLMANRARFPANRVGYGLIEAWANHLAFVLDSEPRFAEYQASLNGSFRYVYSVDNDCTLSQCGQAVFGVDDSFKSVIVFGGLLWDLRRELGGLESAVLMLDSLQFLDLERPLGLRDAVEALVRADERRGGGAHAARILARATARGI